MLVRNLKCDNCGNYKINDLTTGYIYCDFCSALMGFDLNKTQSEKKAESFSDVSEEILNEFSNALNTMAEALMSHNSDEFISAQLRIKYMEFELFPQRFSPKVKQASYKKRYLKYLEAYWVEQIENNFFNQSKKFQIKLNELAKVLSSEIENDEPITVFDKAFESYLNELNEYIKLTVHNSLKAESISLYPEYSIPDFNTLYYQSIDASLQMFNNSTAIQAIKYLGIDFEYITVNDVSVIKKECLVCKSELNVPEKSKSLLCETCGNINDIENEKIQCHTCRELFSYSEDNSCPKCHTKHYGIEEDVINESGDSSMSVGQFFKKLFS